MALLVGNKSLDFCNFYRITNSNLTRQLHNWYGGYDSEAFIIKIECDYKRACRQSSTAKTNTQKCTTGFRLVNFDSIETYVVNIFSASIILILINVHSIGGSSMTSRSLWVKVGAGNAVGLVGML